MLGPWASPTVIEIMPLAGLGESAKSLDYESVRFRVAPRVIEIMPLAGLVESSGVLGP